jgi:hypothetical protein
MRILTITSNKEDLRFVLIVEFSQPACLLVWIIFIPRNIEGRGRHHVVFVKENKHTQNDTYRLEQMAAEGPTELTYHKLTVLKRG